MPSASPSPSHGLFAALLDRFGELGGVELELCGAPGAAPWCRSVIILDNSSTSEVVKPAPSPVVEAWVRAQGGAKLYTTSITLAEIGYGIERLPDGHRKEVLKAAAAEVFFAFTKQVLPFDELAARRYGQIVRNREKVGAPIEGFDAQIASICMADSAALATRNAKDFEGTGIVVIYPWGDRS